MRDQDVQDWQELNQFILRFDRTGVIMAVMRYW